MLVYHGLKQSELAFRFTVVGNKHSELAFFVTAIGNSERIWYLFTIIRREE